MIADGADSGNPARSPAPETPDANASAAPVGLYQIDDNAWLLKYGPIPLGAPKGRDTWQRA